MHSTGPLSYVTPNGAPDLRAVAAHHGLAAVTVVVPLVVLASFLPAAVPRVVVLLSVILVVFVPISCWQIRSTLAREGIRGRAAVQHRLGLTAPTRRDLVRTGGPALVAAIVLPGTVVWLEPPLKATLRLPEAWSTGWPAGLSTEQGAALAALWLFVAVLVGPFVEEVLFRGLLQPRIAATPTRRILAGSVLFTLYHLWQPWAWPAVLLATIPLAWVRERTGSTLLAAGIHITTNAFAWVLLVQGAMTR